LTPIIIQITKSKKRIYRRVNLQKGRSFETRRQCDWEGVGVSPGKKNVFRQITTGTRGDCSEKPSDITIPGGDILSGRETKNRKGEENCSKIPPYLG